MKLRTRLFLWVGALFLGASVGSYYLEEHVTKTNLYKAEANIKSKIESLNEDKRKYIEVFLRNSLAEQEAKINVLLDKIAENQLLLKGFEPSTYNLEHETWINSSLLSVVNKWVDIIQNTNNNTLGSLIAIDPSKMQLSVRVPIADSVAIVALQTKDSQEYFEGPYIGIRLQYNQYLLDPAAQGDMQPDVGRSRYALFPVQQILDLDIAAINAADLSARMGQALSFPFLISEEGAQNFVNQFIVNLKVAQDYLHSQTKLPDSSELGDWVRAQLESKGEDSTPTQWEFEIKREKELYGREINHDITEEIIRLLDRYDEIDMMWGLSTLVATGIFGYSPFDEKAPIGCARFTNGESIGKGVYTHNVFSEKAVFQEPPCQDDLFPSRSNLCLSAGMEVLDAEEMNRTFFSNSLELKVGEGNQERTGYLTLGIDAANILRELSMATHETAVLVANGRVVSVFDASGQRNLSHEWEYLPVENMLNQTAGSVEVGDEDYYYLHMIPFKGMNFHFFIFNPHDVEFALVNALEENANQLIEHISVQMRLASIIGFALVLLFLNNITKRITQPIVKLADAADMLGQGKLENINLPDLKTTRKDEICSLYRTFCKMVDELRDKEKVRGVLNKVVSREIAEEILKGNVHLGGEERTVTVVFADIRGFTKLTEKMPPGEVIELLNTCMTKISHTIDQFGGVIDKYVGDEVMALFGAPVAKEDSSLQAIRSALTITDTLVDWNKERQMQGKPAIEMGIGIHTGVVLAGNMGAENRLNYTVLGSNVNLSSRLCSAASSMQILISDATLNSPLVAETIQTEQIPDLSLKGFTEEITVYAVKGYQHPSGVA